MFRIISLAFAIAQSTVYADDHDWEDDHDEEPSAWEFIFPDQVFLYIIYTWGVHGENFSQKFHVTGLNTGAILFIPDLAVEEVCSRVQNRFFVM